MMFKDEIKEIFDLNFEPKSGASINVTIDAQGRVDVECANLSAKHQGDDGFPVELGIIKGNLWASYCTLHGLKNCPRSVTGTLHLANNEIKSLHGGPQSVGRFDVSHNLLTSLEHGPKSVRTYIVSSNPLTSLKGMPEILEGDLEANNCRLEDLVGAPRIVKGDMELWGNPLGSLRGIPSEIGTFKIEYSPSLGLLGVLNSRIGKLEISDGEGGRNADLEDIVDYWRFEYGYRGMSRNRAMMGLQNDLVRWDWKDNARL